MKENTIPAELYETIKKMEERLSHIDCLLGIALIQNHRLKKVQIEQTNCYEFLQKKIDRLEEKSKPANKDAAEMRKAASMLYARAKQLEAE